MPTVDIDVAGRRQWLLRLQAAAFDLPIIVGWVVFSGAIGAVLRLLDLDFETASAWDVYAFGTLVFPVMLTFALLEASPRRSTPGKRKLWLVVVNPHGGRLTRGRALARSAVKFAPWQMAHTAVFQLVAGSTAAGYVVLSIAAQTLVLASIVTMAVDSQHRSLHDFIAGTRVVLDSTRSPSPG